MASLFVCHNCDQCTICHCCFYFAAVAAVVVAAIVFVVADAVVTTFERLLISAYDFFLPLEIEIDNIVIQTHLIDCTHTHTYRVCVNWQMICMSFVKRPSVISPSALAPNAMRHGYTTEN